MEDLVKYLKSEITDKMSLENIVGVFEKMCQTPIEGDMILFETGTFSFTGEELFYFSLARQFENDEDEYYQIHLDVLYAPTDKNTKFETSIWDEDIDENIFDYIRKSDIFADVKNDEYIKVDIYVDET